MVEQKKVGSLEMKRLIVVGNGFDLAHNLPTSYADFMRYLKIYKKNYENRPFFPRNKKSDFVAEIEEKNYKLYETLTKYIPEQDLWSSFEEALAKIDISELQDEFSYLLKPYGADDWRDSDNHAYQNSIEDALSFSHKISNAFNGWIKDINLMPVCSLPQIEELFAQDKTFSHTNFLSFNYTSTLEKLYNVPFGKICYIHGNAAWDGNLVVGHHNKQLLDYGEPEYFQRLDFQKKGGYDGIEWLTDEQIAELSEEELENYYGYLDSVLPDIKDYEYGDPRDYQAALVMQEYFKATYKDTAKIISEHSPFFDALQGLTEVYILGHSLSDIDFDYFSEIRKKAADLCIWNISYHDENGMARVGEFAEKLGIERMEKILL